MSLAQRATEGLAVMHSFGTSQYAVIGFTRAVCWPVRALDGIFHHGQMYSLFAGGKGLQHSAQRLHSHKSIMNETSRPGYNAQPPHACGGQLSITN